MIAEVMSVLAPEHRDVITTGGQVVIAILGLMAVRQEFGIRRAGKAQEAAQKAVALSEPTGNGYAGRSEQKLDEIAAGMTALALDVGGLRGDHRDLSRRVDQTGYRLDKHLENTN